MVTCIVTAPADVTSIFFQFLTDRQVRSNIIHIYYTSNPIITKLFSQKCFSKSDYELMECPVKLAGSLLTVTGANFHDGMAITPSLCSNVTIVSTALLLCTMTDGIAGISIEVVATVANQSIPAGVANITFGKKQ